MSLTEDIEKDDAGLSLLDELENSPEPEGGDYTESEQWRPEVGDSIEGVVVETYEFPSKYKNAKGEYPTIPGLVLKVDGDDDLWSVVGLHTVLRQEIEKAEPQVGDRVAVIYKGKRPSKKDPDVEFEFYRFAIRRGNGSVTPVQRRSSEEKPAEAKRKPGQKSTESSGSRSTQHEPTARKKPGATKAEAPADHLEPEL